MTPNNIALGKWGEEKATEYLQAKGYTLLEKNYRTPYGEIDIVVKIGAEIVFVEVKTRSSKQFGYPEEAVTEQKQTHMVESAMHYLQEQYPDSEPDWRIDVIAIRKMPGDQPPETSHFENAVS